LTVENKENYIIVMRNVFINKFKINTKYDIKGSSVDRTASIKEKEKDLPTYKDNDLVNDNRQIVLGPEAKSQFMEKLTRDVQFLCDLKIMDYSLLIGIHENKTLQINSNQLNNNNNDNEQQQQQSGDHPILSSSPKNDVDGIGIGIGGGGGGGGTGLGDYYSDQDNFSPGEDAEDTDDGQLNCILIFLFILINIYCVFILLYLNSIRSYTTRKSHFI
jgi:hypothetical protein